MIEEEKLGEVAERARSLLTEAEKKTTKKVNVMCSELVVENRASELDEYPRYMSAILKDDKSEIVFEIYHHYVIAQYYVDVNRTKDYGRGFTETHGKTEFFGATLEECFSWIEKTYKVKIVPKN